jgi:hypothetical protein
MHIIVRYTLYFICHASKDESVTAAFQRGAMNDASIFAAQELER